MKDQPKPLNLNASEKGDIELKETIKKEQSNLWLEEYADFVKDYNQTIAQEGLPLSEWTTFLKSRYPATA